MRLNKDVQISVSKNIYHDMNACTYIQATHRLHFCASPSTYSYIHAHTQI